MIRLGFIGSGGYGRVHIDGFLALQREGLVRITALTDASVAVLDALAEVPELGGVRRFTDYREMLQMEDLDAVVISAPVPVHEEITEAALAKGLFILLEKPPVPMLSQLKKLVKLDRDTHVMVAFQHVYSELIGNFKRELLQGRAGKILSISAQGLWPRSTSYYQRASWAGQLEWEGRAVMDGPCTNAMSHFINLSFYLMGAEEETFAMPAELKGEVYRARPNLASYDTACLAGNFENGSGFSLAFSHAGSELSPIEITIRGEKETLSIREDGKSLLWDAGSQDMRRAFLQFAQGAVEKNRTPLRAMVPYVTATNLMLLSSGGVHNIPEGVIRKIDLEKGGEIFAVENLSDFFGECAEKGTTFSGVPVPWAVCPRLLKASDFIEEELEALIFKCPQDLVSCTGDALPTR